MFERLNVGDAIEDMAKCMTRAALCAAILSIVPEPTDLSDEIRERARLEESGLIECADELAVIAATFEEVGRMEVSIRSEDAGRVLGYWHTYLDQVVQYCAFYKSWEDQMLVITPNAIATWISVWYEKLMNLRAEIAHLIRNRAEQPIVMPAGRLPKNYGLKTA